MWYFMFPTRIFLHCHRDHLLTQSDERPEWCVEHFLGNGRVHLPLKLGWWGCLSGSMG